MKKTKETQNPGTVKVVDETAPEDATINAKNIENLFRAISREAGLVAESRREFVDYAGKYLTITLRVDTTTGLNMAIRASPGVAPVRGPVIARFTAREEEISTLPSSITIQFYDKYRERLAGFIAATEKAAKNFEVDIEIRVVKMLSL